MRDNPKWESRYMGYLKEIWKNSNKAKKGFKKPEGLSVYTTVGTRNRRVYYLRFKGQNVGEVYITDKTNKIRLRSLVKDSRSHDIKNCPLSTKNPVDWDSKEASEFRDYFRRLSLDTRTKSPEHYVESSLLKEFRKSSRIGKVLPNIQPILLHGNFFQMPTPLKAITHNPSYSKQNGGGIDILARI
ncbi:MAG: hypothetical protein K2M25_05810, partial [Muribaculaceae bacterium]|nr:hypothetical protein [Muribaculaceae bacterium]